MMSAPPRRVPRAPAGKPGHDGDNITITPERGNAAPQRQAAVQALAAGGDNPRLVQVGTVGATAIMVDVRFLFPAVPVRVLLTQPYAITRPPGYPSRPSMTGVAAANLDTASTVASGTTIAVLKPEADALVAAGGGTYA
jgi:hypothetical protein